MQIHLYLYGCVYNPTVQDQIMAAEIRNCVCILADHCGTRSPECTHAREFATYTPNASFIWGGRSTSQVESKQTRLARSIACQGNRSFHRKVQLGDRLAWQYAFGCSVVNNSGQNRPQSSKCCSNLLRAPRALGRRSSLLGISLL